MTRKNAKSKKKSIYDLYREMLAKPELTEQEIDVMRRNVQMVARAMCEHVWGKSFY